MNINQNVWCGETVYGFSSYKCQCVQELIDCIPEDEFDNVIICDNIDNIVSSSSRDTAIRESFFSTFSKNLHAFQFHFVAF